MQIKLKVLNVEVTDSGKYKMAEVTYKNLGEDKTETRKIPSFKNPDVFKTLVNAKAGDVFTVEAVKDGQYWVWSRIGTGGDGLAETGSRVSGTGAASQSPRSTYETPEERAKRQVLIVRQSAISSAISLLASGAKSPAKVDEVLAVAKQFEKYVFGTDPIEQLKSMPDDLPAPVSLD